jgi:hypothetical protein
MMGKALLYCAFYVGSKEALQRGSWWSHMNASLYTAAVLFGTQ